MRKYKVAVRNESEHASMKQTSKQANKRASEQASTQTSEQASKRGKRKISIPNHPPTSTPSPCFRVMKLLLATAAFASTAALLTTSPIAAAAVATDAPGAASNGKVDHVVLLVMENRPYDHFFGWADLPGADGLDGTECNYKNVSDPSQGQGCVQKGKAKYVCQDAASMSYSVGCLSSLSSFHVAV